MSTKGAAQVRGPTLQRATSVDKNLFNLRTAALSCSWNATVQSKECLSEL